MSEQSSPVKPVEMRAVRQTSLEAFNQITSEGLLSRMRWIVYNLVYCNPLETAQELAAHITAPESNSSVGLNLHARLGELRERGVIRETGARKCSKTKRKAMTWEVTRQLPHKPEKRERTTPAAIIEALTLELAVAMDLIATLEAERDEARAESSDLQKARADDHADLP